MQNIIIPNPEKLEEIKKKIFKEGKNKLHIISDFDRTLTQGIVEGRKSASLISHIRGGDYLTQEYPAKAHGLYDKYHPIEINPNITLEEKKKAMGEWWGKHTQLLIDSGVSQEVIEDIVKKKDAYFRKGCFEFFDSLNKNNIPLIIMSAGPGQIIKGFLKKEDKLYPNIHIIANFFKFNKDGIAIGRREPVIHTFNKTETEVKELPVYNELLKRKNVLLLGDNLGDLGMIKGFPYENLIKIGFLTENVEENLEPFKQEFDIIILNDGNMDYINNLIKQIIES
jgi:5'-nucleotidase